jgi:hypothetical protein
MAVVRAGDDINSAVEIKNSTKQALRTDHNNKQPGAPLEMIDSPQ